MRACDPQSLPRLSWGLVSEEACCCARYFASFFYVIFRTSCLSVAKQQAVRWVAREINACLKNRLFLIMIFHNNVLVASFS